MVHCLLNNCICVHLFTCLKKPSIKFFQIAFKKNALTFIFMFQLLAKSYFNLPQAVFSTLVASCTIIYKEVLMPVPPHFVERLHTGQATTLLISPSTTV